MKTAEEWAEQCFVYDYPENWWSDPTDIIRAAQRDAIEAAARVAGPRYTIEQFEGLTVLGQTLDAMRGECAKEIRSLLPPAP